MMGMTLKIEGSMPLLTEGQRAFDGTDPWALIIKKHSVAPLAQGLGLPYKLSLETTRFVEAPQCRQVKTQHILRSG